MCSCFFRQLFLSPDKIQLSNTPGEKKGEIHDPLKSIQTVVLTSVGFDQTFDAIAVSPEVIHLNLQDLKIA